MGVHRGLRRVRLERGWGLSGTQLRSRLGPPLHTTALHLIGHEANLLLLRIFLLWIILKGELRTWGRAHRRLAQPSMDVLLVSHHRRASPTCATTAPLCCSCICC